MKPIQSTRATGRIPRIADFRQRDGDGHRPDRQVDEEDPSPPDPAGEHSAHQRTYGHGTPDDRPIDAEGGAPLPSGEGLGDEGQGGGEHDGAANPLNSPSKVQHQRSGRQPADQGRHRKNEKSEGEQSPTAEHVSYDTGREEEGGQGEGVSVNYPLEVGKGGMK